MHALLTDLRPVRQPARVLYATAAFWTVSAVLHIVPLAMDGWDWTGAVSFRKPLVFSLSVALMLATAGWVLDRLPDRPRLAGGLAWTLAVSSTVEVALIVVQTWRGQPSHFNMLSAADGAVFSAMAAMIAVMSACLVVLFIWSLRRRPSDPLVRTAVIAGLATLMTGLGFGQWIVNLGVEYVVANQAVPGTVIAGEQGVAKFPHAVALHGIQVFIAAALGLRHGSLPFGAQHRWLHTVVAAFTGVLIAASGQTIAGYAPMQPSIWSAIGLVSAVAGVATLIRIGFAFFRAPATTEPESPAAQLQ